MAKQAKLESLGLGVDAWGGPVVDPSKNVIALGAAEAKRQDDLRQAQEKLFDREVANTRDFIGLHISYLRLLSVSEAGRIDSIRRVDREEVKQMRLEAQSAIKTLAETTTTMAETLRNQQSSTASTLAKAQQDQWSEANKRLSALELSSSEGKGQKTVADPMMAEIIAEVRRQATVGATTEGQGKGGEKTWKYIFAGCGLLLTAGGFVITFLVVIAGIVAYAVRAGG